MKHSKIMLAASLCIGLATASMAQDAKPSSSQPAQKAAAPHGGAQPALPADLAKMFKLNAKYNSVTNRTYDATRFPGAGDTVFQEDGGLRPWLLKQGIGYNIQNVTGFQYNLSNPPMFGANGPDSSGNYHPATAGTAQSYVGQRPSFNNNTYVYVMKNFGENTQFVGCVEEVWTNTVFATNVDTPRVCEISLSQLLFDKKMKVILGYQNDAAQFWGMYTAGNIASQTLGMLAILPFAEGEANVNMAAPAVSVRYNFTKNFYNHAQVQRSHSPVSSTLNYHDMGNLRFSVKGAKANITEEIGYKRAPAKGVKEIWARADGFYNFTHFNRWDSWNNTTHQFTKKSDNNWGYYAGVDWQALQAKSGLPSRGLFLGGTVEYIPPQQNLYSQYYEFRAYYRGLMKSRPLDMITAGLNDLEFSKPAISYLKTVKHATTANTDQINYTASYVAHVRHGLWWNAGIDYVVHPSTVPKMPNAFLVSTGTAIFF